MSFTLIVLVILALLFDFLNGVHDSSNIVATMISSRAMGPRSALAMTAIATLAGPFIFGVAVANTIGNDIAVSEALNMTVIISALASAIVWNILTWILGLPSSSSHALIGGIVGAVFAGAGAGALRSEGIIKVLIALFASPIIGFAAGYLITNLIHLLAWKASPRINGTFKKLQILTSLGLALSHGTNDSQKTMGIITLGLLLEGMIASFKVPFWVIAACAGAIALGTSIGGWRLIKTLGSKFYKIRPVDGFASQITSAAVIILASVFGLPVSTTQVVSTAIMGVGAADRINKVRWSVAGEIVSAWLITIPATALLAGGLYWLIHSAVPFIINLF